MQSQDRELVELLARCSLRDQSALSELYQRLAPFLNGVAFRILHSDELSNEVLQEAFVQIWQKASTYREDKAKPLTWITSIVRYRSIDKLQAEQRHRNRLDHEQEVLALAQLESHAKPDSDYEQDQVKAHIHECLEQMNDKIKLCIELAYLRGYSREELAECFDTKVNTVKSWLHRGSEKLKQCLNTKQQKTA